MLHSNKITCFLLYLLKHSLYMRALQIKGEGVPPTLFGKARKKVSTRGVPRSAQASPSWSPPGVLHEFNRLCRVFWQKMAGFCKDFWVLTNLSTFPIMEHTKCFLRTLPYICRKVYTNNNGCFLKFLLNFVFWTVFSNNLLKWRHLLFPFFSSSQKQISLYVPYVTAAPRTVLSTFS